MPEPDRSQTALRILVVEDDELDRREQVRHLERLTTPVTIVEAASVTEARTELGQHPFDVAVVDSQLGDGQGLDLLEALGNTPTILLTGRDCKQLPAEALRRGASHFLIKDAEGHHLTLLTPTVDKILAWRQAEVELLRSQEKLRTTLASISDLVFTLDRDGIFTEYHQPNHVPELYAPPEAFLGRNYQEILPPPVAQLVARAVEQVLATGERQQIEYPLPIGDGEEWYTALVSGRRRPDGAVIEGFTVVVQKITERKLAEQRLQESRDQLRRLVAELEAANAKLEATNAELEFFVHTVSHDLRAPLVTIRGFVGMLRQDLDQNRTDLIAKDLRAIDEASQKMGDLLSDLLKLSRLGRVINPPEPVALDELVAEVLRHVVGAVEARGVEVDVAPDLPLVVVDRKRFFEVLLNLIENAARFMGDQPAPRIEIRAQQDEKRTLIIIADNGIGIEAPHHDKIFDLFQRFDVATPGTGVGLALVKRIVEAHGGRVWVESEGRGKGSRFLVALPRH